MKARDIMTPDVVSVGPDLPTRAVAKLLAAHGISAVPVLDAAGAPIGMVSEGDLIGRNDSDRRARRDWWLTLLAEGEQLHPDFLTSLRDPDPPVRNVMTSPVVTVGEDTETPEIAALLVSHHIKRVPVVRDGRVVGIVSRADLVAALAAEAPAKTATTPHGGLFADAINGIEDRFRHRRERRETEAVVVSSPAGDAAEAGLTVDDFRALVADHNRATAAKKGAEEQLLGEQRRHRIAELIDEHISDDGWRQLVHKAHDAAARGEREFMLLRFPSTLCSDGGRAVNAAQPGWPATLRGEPAELFLRWDRDLRSRGFPIAARVLDFPGGMPGDIGLFLQWAS